METKLKIGKKGGARRVADKLKNILQSPIAASVLRIVDDCAEMERAKPAKKIAGDR